MDQDGQLLSYGDAGTPGNVSDPVVVGFGGWQDFKTLFSGRNVAGEDRIYAVDQNGQLLSYGDCWNPVMFRPPWSSASAGGRTSGFSSRVGTSPVRTGSTLWLPDKGMEPADQRGRYVGAATTSRRRPARRTTRTW